MHRQKYTLIPVLCVCMYVMRHMRLGPNLHDYFRMNHTSCLDGDAVVDHVKCLFPAFSVFFFCLFVCLFCLKSNSHCRHQKADVTLCSVNAKYIRIPIPLRKTSNHCILLFFLNQWQACLTSAAENIQCINSP